MGRSWDSWYVHLPDDLMAAAICLLAARFLLELVVPAGRDNRAWRTLCRLTDWAVGVASWITPRIVPQPLPVLLAAFWLVLARALFRIATVAAGLAPAVGPGTP